MKTQTDTPNEQTALLSIHNQNNQNIHLHLHHYKDKDKVKDKETPQSTINTNKNKKIINNLDNYQSLHHDDNQNPYHFHYEDNHGDNPNDNNSLSFSKTQNQTEVIIQPSEINKEKEKVDKHLDPHKHEYKSNGNRLILFFLFLLFFVAILFAFIIFKREKLTMWLLEEKEESKNFLFFSSLADKNFYRFITLNNKLQVLLISNNESSMGSVSLSVGVGSFEDNYYNNDFSLNVLGLAHLCEHMLFLGSKKFPLPSSYHNYISNNGGKANAKTGAIETEFYFEIENSKLFLPGALERFSQFFISPLFPLEKIVTEVQNIHAEFKKNVLSDSWRQYQLLKHLSVKPFKTFSTGNLFTLLNNNSTNQTHILSLREKLLLFYNHFYSSNLMKLVVYGAQSLDELQQLVETYFGQIKNKNVEVPSWPGLIPFPAKTESSPLGRILFYNTINRGTTLTLYFPLPSIRPTIKYDPTGYLSYFLGHESSGSLLLYLRNLGLVDSLTASNAVSFDGFAVYYIRMKLAPSAREHISAIIEYFFSYLELLRHGTGNGGIGIANQNIWEEREAVSSINFRFKDPQAPLPFTKELANRMQWLLFKDEPSTCAKYQKKILEEVNGESNDIKYKYLLNNDCVNASFLLNPPEFHLFNSSLIQYFLDTYFIPSNMFVFLGSPDAVDFLLNQFKDDQYLPLSTAESDNKLNYQAQGSSNQASNHNFHLFSAKPKLNTLNERGSISHSTKKESIRNKNLFEPPPVETEPYYSIDFVRVSFNDEDVARWSFPQKITQLGLPPPNIFLPTKRSPLKPVSLKSPHSPFPRVLFSDSIFRLWYRKDSSFIAPRTALFIAIYSPVVFASPHAMACARMYHGLVLRSFASEAYQAHLAGFEYKFKVVQTGFEIIVNGYTDRMETYVDALFRHLLQPNVDQTAFELRKSMVSERYENFILRKAHVQARHYQSLYFTKIPYTHLELIDAIHSISLASLSGFMVQLLHTAFIECYIYGSNINPSMAKVIVGEPLHRIVERTKDQSSSISGDLRGDAASSDVPFPQLVMMSLKPGSYIYSAVNLNPSDSNSCVLVSFQIGSFLSIRESIALDVIAQVLHQPIFNTLRTKWALGYIVWCSAHTHAGTLRTLDIVVMGTKYDPIVMDDAVELFLEKFYENIILGQGQEQEQDQSMENHHQNHRDNQSPFEFEFADIELHNNRSDTLLSESTFSAHIESLIAIKQSKSISLLSNGMKDWKHIIDRNYDFSRLQAEIVLLKQYTLTQFKIDFVDMLLNPSRRRRFSVRIFGSDHSNKFNKGRGQGQAQDPLPSNMRDSDSEVPAAINVNEMDHQMFLEQFLTPMHSPTPFDFNHSTFSYDPFYSNYKMNPLSR